ncbi:MAG TPA: GTP-binding protein [Pyrodictium sp.]|nr:GTP-binding protein [Pyrodictium sp.]
MIVDKIAVEHGQEIDKVAPWLQRHIQAMRMREVVEKLKKIYVPSAEEIVKYVGERYKRLRPRRRGLAGRREFEIKRLELVYNIVRDKLQKVLEMPRLEAMDEFHRRLIEEFIGAEVYEEALKRVRLAIKLARRFWDEYRVLIATSQSVEEAKKYRKEGCGRILSLVRRLDKHLKLLRRVREELVQTHVVSEGLPVVVVAGIPSAGKSTLISRLSTAKPEVAPYPFTTKNIIVGKVVFKNQIFYMVDTPGILERPMHQHNQIERKALVALTSLPDAILFLYDVSAERVQDVVYQTRLLEDIIRNIALKNGVKVVIAINKIDVADREALQKTYQYIEEIKKKYDSVVVGPYNISALKGIGVEQLLNELIKLLPSKG